MKRILAVVHVTFLLVVIGFTVGCGGDKTGQVVVGIVTDLGSPTLSNLRIHVTTAASLADASVEGVVLSPTTGLPGTYVLRSESQVPVRIEVVGRDAQANNRVTRAATFEVLSGKTQFLRVALLQSCVDVNCPAAGTTCIEGTCVYAQVSKDDLETYTPEKATTADCMGRSTLLVTATGKPMPLRNPGTCGPGRACIEGTCRLTGS